MNDEAFYISDTALRQRRRTLLLVPLAALAVVAFQFWSHPADVMTLVFVAGCIVAIAVFIARSQYRQYVAFASRHWIELAEDAMVFRNGEVETRIPYSTIGKMTVMDSIQQPRTIVLKLMDGSTETLSGYAEMRTLAERLSRKIPPDRLVVRKWIYF